MINVNNYYEQLVIDQLWKLIEHSPELISQIALEDIACLALNQLPNCYVRNMVDKCISINDEAYQEMCQEVSIAIANAVKQVNLRPHDTREFN